MRKKIGFIWEWWMFFSNWYSKRALLLDISKNIPFSEENFQKVLSVVVSQQEAISRLTKENEELKQRVKDLISFKQGQP